jgi:hypothetical protein
MSDTPRTDAHVTENGLRTFATEDEHAGVEYTYADFARQLEHELAAANECIAALHRESDKADLHIREVEDIGQLVGCDHVEGLARCVKDRIEELEQLLIASDARVKKAFAVGYKDWESGNALLKAQLAEVTAERDKLKGFYDEIVKELGHDCVLRELRDAKAQLASARNALIGAPLFPATREAIRAMRKETP